MKTKIIHIINHGNGITENHCDNGSTIWKKNGKRHKDNGPAVKYLDGSYEWYQKGRLHRENGPAVVIPFELSEWYINGKRHREEGPASIRLSVYESKEIQEWWFNGKQYDVNNPKELHALVLKEQLDNEIAQKTDSNLSNNKKIKI